MFDFNVEFIRMIADHVLDTVVILSHIRPDGDAAGAVMALAHYIQNTYKNMIVIPYLGQDMSRGPKEYVLQDGCFQPFIKPDLEGKRYAVIVCDTANVSRIHMKQFFFGAEVTMNIDHHISNTDYADVNYMKVSESCCENIFHMLNKNDLRECACKSHPNAADYLYLGIIQDTGGFDRANERTMDAAKRLLSAGVDHSKLMNTRKRDSFDTLKKRAYMISKCQTAPGLMAAYVCIDRLEAEAKGILYDDIHPISEYLRDCRDIELGISLFEIEKGIWKISFRSDGRWIDCDKLAKCFGGGGHKGAAGLTVEREDVGALIAEIFEKVYRLTTG